MNSPFVTFVVEAVTIPSTPYRVPGGEVQAGLVLGYGALTIAGAQIVQADSGALHVWFPRLGRGNRLALHGQQERDELLAVALAAFRKATGRNLAAPPVAKASLIKDLPS